MNILDSIVDGALALPSREDSDALICAVVRYMRLGEEPQGLSATASAAWTMIAPVVENSRSRSESGRRGGAARKSRADECASKTASKPASKTASKTPSKRASKTPSKRASEHSSSLLIPNSYSSIPESTGVEGCGEEGFEPPTLDEVTAYFATNGLRGDPSEFFDHFAGQGWMRGNGMPVIDWRAVARQWSRKQVEFDQSKPPEARQPVEALAIAENRRDYEAELAAMGGGA